MKFLIFLAYAPAVFCNAEKETTYVRKRELTTSVVFQNKDESIPAARAENDAFWASYLQSLDSFPTTAPTAAPTNDCEVDLILNCTFVSPETGAVTPCEELDAIENIHCTCPECARELLFTYTGNGCDGLERCTDGNMEPGSPANITFSRCNATMPAVTQTVVVGDIITVSLGNDVCLPDCMNVTVTNPVTGMVEQSIRINTSCDDRGLRLKNSYGAIEFVGYTCNENDVNNCFQDIAYGVAACNPGFADFMLFEFIFFFDGETTDFLNGLRPIVEPGKCYEENVEEVIDTCIGGEYIANATTKATNTIPERDT